jgi:hypothetical protein
MRFIVTFQFVGTASGFPFYEIVYADSKTSAKQIAEKVAKKFGYRILKIEYFE